MPSVAFARLAAELAEFYAPPYAKTTLRQVRQVCREFSEIGIRRTAELTPLAIQRWIRAHPTRSPATVRSHLRMLRACCQYAYSCGYLKLNPVDFKRPSQWIRDDAVVSEKPKIQRHLTTDQVRRILDRADAEALAGAWLEARLQALVYTYAYTGVRASEALQLPIACVDLKARTITVAPRPDWKPKTVTSARVLPMAEPLYRVMKDWIPRTSGPSFFMLPNARRFVFPGIRHRGPWVHGNRNDRPLNQVQALAVRAGVPGVTILGFRKTFCTSCKLWGIDPDGRRQIAGHTTTKTAEVYYDESDLDILRTLVGRIRYG